LSGSGQLTAAITDERWEGDMPRPVSGAEYFIDVPSEDGAGFPMSPIDGDWGDLPEEVAAPVATAALTPGQHILVHGQNDAGHWGPFSAVLVRTRHRAYLPLVMEGPYAR
jgi:hypothetical protein